MGWGEAGVNLKGRRAGEAGVKSGRSPKVPPHRIPAMLPFSSQHLAVLPLPSPSCSALRLSAVPPELPRNRLFWWQHWGGGTCSLGIPLLSLMQRA